MTMHTLRRELAYPQDRLFDLVADVERYPDFVPWWAAARIQKRESATVYFTDQIIRMGPLSQRFVSRTDLAPPDHIRVSSNMKPFDRLLIDWRFAPARVGSLVELSLDFRFKSATMARMLKLVSGEAAHTLMKAFEQRANLLYGPQQLGLDGIGQLQ